MSQATVAAAVSRGFSNLWRPGSVPASVGVLRTKRWRHMSHRAASCAEEDSNGELRRVGSLWTYATVWTGRIAPPWTRDNTWLNRWLRAGAFVRQCYAAGQNRRDRGRCRALSVSFSSSLFMSWSIFMSARVNGSYSGNSKRTGMVFGGVLPERGKPSVRQGSCRHCTSKVSTVVGCCGGRGVRGEFGV